MHNTLSACALGLMIVTSLAGADNEKQIDAVLKGYADAVEKADQIRAKAVEKSQDAAISQLIKLAGKAHTEKDQAAETNAWKAVLKLENSHPKALKFFTDLGQLEKVQEQLAAEGTLGIEKSAKLVGKWIILFNDSTVTSITINPNATVIYARQQKNPQTYPIGKDGGSFLVKVASLNAIERWTFAGTKLFVEHWGPGSLYTEGKAPNYFGYAVKDE